MNNFLIVKKNFYIIKTKKMTEKQIVRILKYKIKCIDNGYKYVGKFRGKTSTKIKCMCNDCGEINIFHSGALMKNEISCKNCLEIKYKNKCEKNGYKYIKCFIEKKRTKVKCICNSCVEINIFHSTALMRGGISCKNCLKLKYKNQCLENCYKYIKHFVEKGNTMIKCSCNDCGEINFFRSNALMNNSIKCKCEKKIFVRGFIYKLTIGCYYYIGITDTTIKIRYLCHNNSCFNKRNKKCELTYNLKLYRIIRKELYRLTKKSINDITSKDFKKYVKIKQVTVIYTSREDLRKLESKLINLDNPSCLNSRN